MGVGGQYLGAALTWGASFAFIKIGLEGLSPAQVVLGRVGAGAVTLLLVLAWTGGRLPRGRRVWAHLSVAGVLLCVVPFLLFAWAETRIDSGLASIYNATTPLMTLLVATLALPEEPPTRARVGGLLTGFAGVLLVLSPWAGLDAGALAGSTVAQAACLGATACYGVAFVHMRRFVIPLRLGALPTATGQVGVAALIMLGLSPFVAAQPVHLSVRVVLAIAALGALGTGLAYVWNANVINGWGATAASTVTYLTPLVGVTIGVLALHERVTWNEPVGGLVVLLGIAVSQGRLRRTSREQNGPSRDAASRTE